MLPIILASGSKNRQAIMQALGFPFKVEVSNFDEQSIKENDFSLRAGKIAQGKAQAVAETQIGLIIAADTFTVFEGQIMEKPKSKDEARLMLNELSQQSATSYTGFCYLNSQTKEEILKTAVTKISFRKLYEAEIEDYLEKYPVTTWAAGYALIDDYLFTLASRLEGSLVGLTHGLPTEWLVPLLIKEGYEIKLFSA